MTRGETETSERETAEVPPLLAHRGWKVGDTVALCGARIMGIPTPPNYPHMCVVCEALAGEGQEA